MTRYVDGRPVPTREKIDTRILAEAESLLADGCTLGAITGPAIRGSLEIADHEFEARRAMERSLDEREGAEAGEDTNHQRPTYEEVNPVQTAIRILLLWFDDRERPLPNRALQLIEAEHPGFLDSFEAVDDPEERFYAAWKTTRYAFGETLVRRAAARSERLRWHLRGLGYRHPMLAGRGFRFVNFTMELSVLLGDGEIFFAREPVAAALGIAPRSVHNYATILVDEGALRYTYRARPGEIGNASRYILDMNRLSLLRGYETEEDTIALAASDERWSDER